MGEEEGIDVFWKEAAQRDLTHRVREGESTLVRYGAPIVRNWGDAVRCVVTMTTQITGRLVARSTYLKNHWQ